MKYEQFLEEVANNIKNYLPEEYQDAKVSTESIKKNNNTQLQSITIKKPGESISPVIYMESYYEAFRKGEMDMNDVCSKIAQTRMNCNKEILSIPNVRDFESVKDKIIFKLVGAEANKEMLSQIPHRMVQDMAVTYHILAHKDMYGEIGTIRIDNRFKNAYGCQENELYKVAMKNTPELFPSSLDSMENIVKDMMEEMGMTPELDEMPGLNMYILTNVQKLNGAAVLLYPDVQQHLYQALGKEYYVLPSSIHESIILPKEADMKPDMLKEMVREVNMTQVEPEEVLTNNVYEYDAKAKTLTIADDPLYKANKLDIKRSGFKPTKNLVKNMESLNKATGKNNTLKDVKEILKSPSATETQKEIANDIAKECKMQELSQQQNMP